MAVFSLISSLTYGMDEKQKSGYFAGIDLGSSSFSYGDSVSLSTGGSSYSSYPTSVFDFTPLTQTAFTYGLKGGYQLYVTPKQGFRIGGHISMGSYIRQAKDTSAMKGKTSSATDMEKKANYFGLRYGVDVDYLYDFYNTNRDSIGLSFGLGYELANYIAGKTTITDGTSIITYKNSLFGNGAYLNLGAHYYLNHNQFEFGVKIPFNVFGFFTSYVASGEEKQSIPSTSSMPIEGYQTANLVVSTTVNFSYTYRF